MDNDNDEYGFRETTDFVGDAIAIDPSGCGCLHCGTGSAINADDEDAMNRLAAASLAGRPIVNRTSEAFALVEDLYGEPRFVSIGYTRIVHATFTPEY